MTRFSLLLLLVVFLVRCSIDDSENHQNKTHINSGILHCVSDDFTGNAVFVFPSMCGSCNQLVQDFILNLVSEQTLIISTFADSLLVKEFFSSKPKIQFKFFSSEYLEKYGLKLGSSKLYILQNGLVQFEGVISPNKKMLENLNTEINSLEFDLTE